MKKKVGLGGQLRRRSSSGKAICFRGYKINETDDFPPKFVEWYCFEVSHKKMENVFNNQHQCDRGEEFWDPPTLLPFSQTASEDTIPTESCVAVGSILYRFGSSGEDGKSVRCINLSENNNGCWNDCAPMLEYRFQPSVAVLDGKIYIIGGTRMGHVWAEVKGHVWAEVYDPSSLNNQSEPLPIIPVLNAELFSRPMFCAAIDTASKKMILVSYDKKVFYGYDPTTKSWQDFNIYPRRFDPSAAIIVNQFMYWFYYDAVFALDLELSIPYFGKVPGIYNEFIIYAHGLGDKGRCKFEPTLVHLEGDEFCLFWVDNLPSSPARSHCLKFQISKCDYLREKCPMLNMNISVLACQTYALDVDPCTTFNRVVTSFKVEENDDRLSRQLVKLSPDIGNIKSSKVAASCTKAAYKGCSTPLRTTPAVASVPQYFSGTPQSANRSFLKTMGTCRNKSVFPTTITSPFRFRTEERAARRKEKLEEKSNEKVAQNVKQLQTKLKSSRRRHN